MTLTPDAVVVVLSPAFLRKKHPLQELRLVMEQRRRQLSSHTTPSQRIVAMLHNLTFEDCRTTFQQQDSSDAAGSMSIGFSASTAAAYRQAVEELLEGRSVLRPDQVQLLVNPVPQYVPPPMSRLCLPCNVLLQSIKDRLVDYMKQLAMLPIWQFR